MKALWMKWMVPVFALSLLAACGGGGGGGGDTTGGGNPGADSVSFVISGGTTTVRTETYDLTVPIYHYDPYIYGNYVVLSGAPGSDKTFLYAYSQFNAGFKETFAITFGGQTTGGFPVGGKNAVSLTTQSFVYVASSGTITVDAYGAVGGRIRGTFSVSNGTSPMSGAFSVTREADQ